MDLDMPQLRQLVLKNTERIDKNDTTAGRAA